MTLRLSKTVLLGAIAFFYTIVVFNNLTDYNSNYLFVYHVLDMDSTFPGNHGMWRALHSAYLYRAFYDSIIGWETITALLAWTGTIALARKLRSSALDFNRAKQTAVIALTLGMLMWFVAFLTVGAEWFLMWQSKTWNGQEAAFRMFTILAAVLLLLALPDTEEQP